MGPSGLAAFGAVLDAGSRKHLNLPGCVRAEDKVKEFREGTFS